MSMNASRREFMKRMAALGGLGVAMPFGLNLASIAAASNAQAASGPNALEDYKALVCVYLYGGNDAYNTVVPYDTASYTTYQTLRSTIAFTQAALAPTVISPITAQGGRQFALNPSMAALATLFSQGHAAIVPNVGALVEPILDVTAYKSAATHKPAKLFSHSDMETAWQAPNSTVSLNGWGGRMADLLMGQNSETSFTAVSLSGSTVMLAGNTLTQYQVSSSGSVAISPAKASWLLGSSTAPAILKQIITAPQAGLLENEHTKVVTHSMAMDALLSSAISPIPTSDARLVLPAALSSNRLAQQLQMVARMIAARVALGQKRQVFFVGIGGFDTHSSQAQNHALLWSGLAQSIQYFYNTTVNLGLANNVTLFTASEFGRTLTNNGDGTDHGWGGHHFVVGGAVKGKDIYGSMPTAALKTTLDVGNGRLLPQIAVDQYAATLARWMGVAASDLPLILPNIGRYSSSDLGFML